MGRFPMLGDVANRGVSEDLCRHDRTGGSCPPRSRRRRGSMWTRLGTAGSEEGPVVSAGVVAALALAGIAAAPLRLRGCCCGRARHDRDGGASFRSGRGDGRDEAMQGSHPHHRLQGAAAADEEDGLPCRHDSLGALEAPRALSAGRWRPLVPVLHALLPPHPLPVLHRDHLRRRSSS
jgi:hypothetical protein